jgi:hypothetical protein
VVGIGLTLAGVGLNAQKEFSPANRDRGKAAVEFRDKDVQIVAAYYYSQRNHNMRWLMIEAAMSTTAENVIARKAITLVTPEGVEVPLATQEQVAADVNQIQALLRNASTVGHDVASYFTQTDRIENMNLFTLPFGGVVHDSFVVDRDRVAVGRLFFAAPKTAWPPGTYALAVRHSKGRAELPIRLE